MAYIVLSDERVKLLKRVVAGLLPELGSSHCYECIAFAYGYRSYASMREAGRDGIWIPPQRFSADRFVARLRELSEDPVHLQWIESFHADILYKLDLEDMSPHWFDFGLFEPGTPLLEPGTVVIVRTVRVPTAPRGSRALVVRAEVDNEGRSGAEIHTEAGRTDVARSWIHLPDEPLPPQVPMRLWLPYGQWTERDGSKVLFSRDYKPLWKVEPDGSVTRDKPWRLVHHVDQELFFDRGDGIWTDHRRQKELMGMLVKLGARGLPHMCLALESLVRFELYDEHMAAIDLRPADDPDEVCRLYE